MMARVVWRPKAITTADDSVSVSPAYVVSLELIIMVQGHLKHSANYKVKTVFVRASWSAMI